MIPYLEQLRGRLRRSRPRRRRIARRRIGHARLRAAARLHLRAQRAGARSRPARQDCCSRHFIARRADEVPRACCSSAAAARTCCRAGSSRRRSPRPVQVPEYDTPWNAYPTGVRRKDFDYGIYQLSLGQSGGGRFALDVGDRDDLNVVRFYAKETNGGAHDSVDGPQSFVAIPGLDGHRARGRARDARRRPPGGRAAGPVEVFFDDSLLGTRRRRPGFQAYHLALPADARAPRGGDDRPGAAATGHRVHVEPAALLGGADDRTSASWWIGWKCTDDVRSACLQDLRPSRARAGPAGGRRCSRPSAG